jgi:hypothetical protein
MRRFIAFLGCLGLTVASLPWLGACGGTIVSDEQDSGKGSGRDSGLEAAPDVGDEVTPARDALAPVDAGADGPFAEAKHAPFPEVIYQGGGILTAPELVTVTFPGDPLAAQLAAFGQTIEASSWWTSVTSGYCEKGGSPCVSAGSPAMSVAYPSAPAAMYTDSDQGGPSSIRDFLATALDTSVLPAPAPGAVSNTLYLLYFQTTTKIVYDGSSSCEAFDGYHGSMTYNGQQVPYAIIPECSGPSAGETPPITTLENTTITASHEILEAATDPNDLALGYFLDFNQVANYGWLDVQGGEVADLCVDPFLLAQDEWPESSFVVQRIWSNANAKAGLDPCVPVPASEVYFSGAPVQSFFVMDVGSTLMFEVDAFSTGPRADWTLSAQDWTDSNTSYLSFEIVGGTEDPTLGSVIQANNGSKIQVKMTLTKDPGNTGSYEADGSIVSISGSIKNPTAANYWPFAVMTPADAADSGIDAAVSMGSRRAGIGRRGGPFPRRYR